MAESSTHVLELHSAIKQDIEGMAMGHPAGHRLKAISPAMLGGLEVLAQTFVPILTEFALAKVRVPVEDFVKSHKDAVRKFVSEKALEYADRLIRDLEDAPGPVVPGP